MQSAVKIALDVMSGEHGIDAAVEASAIALRRWPKLSVIFVGDEALLAPALAKHGIRSRGSVHPASEVVTMDEHPRDALRRKKDSSMRVAINLVREGAADAAVSAGNTGALMAIARFVLRTIPGIDRPAIISQIPAVGGHTYMLDLGANADCTPEQLYQFGVMGTVIAQETGGIAKPRVGLLNIGEEEIKGTHTIRSAGELLAASRLNYIGFVEGDDIFSGDVDVVVAEGFTGNISLKTMEGAARLMASSMKRAFSRNIFTKGMGLVAMPVLKSWKASLDPRRYNGASLVGLNRIVIKSHGSSDAIALSSALDVAVTEVRRDVPGHIRQYVKKETGQAS